ncbi:MAG TPA: exopolysaccharide biosynthesis polyprenyl glycosylphosphotransferase, partial [Acidimicrobiales bacterium]|nr:exopolysaccharide biosynthesis polyprenyl glycosylphosphotransferase [Acidimicrobiales bacterium]
GRATARERSAPVLLIGAGPDVVTFARELCSAEAIDIAGLAADAVDAAYDGEVPLRGSILDAPAIARELGVATALIVCAGVDGRRLSWLVRRLTLDGVWVELCPSVGGLRPSRLSVSSLGRYQVLTVAPAPHDAAAAWCKRAFDLAVAVVLLAAALPLLAVAAVAIKLDSPGPVLFRQTRLGRGARPFSILKLRTMSAGDHSVIDLRSQGNDADGPLFKLRRDPRVTRVGAVLRRYSLDELPQLWNVIRDDMSLIGPRPALQSEADLWELEIYDRLRVKPGITGMWQVSGRSDLSFEEYVRLDLYYVDNWSLRIDLAILLKTLPAVFGSRGAY